MSWAEAEFETLDLGDTRLNKRTINLIEDFSAKPKGGGSVKRSIGAG